MGVLQLARSLDDDLGAGLASLRAVGLDALDNIHALNNLAKDNVLAIEPGGLHGGQEELGAVGVGARVGHGEDTCTGEEEGRRGWGEEDQSSTTSLQSMIQFQSFVTKYYSTTLEHTRASVLQGEVLISELGTIDGLAASPVVVGEVTTLAHKVGDDTVCRKGKGGS